MSPVESSDTNAPQYPLPCVVQIGFAGARNLFDAPTVDAERTVQSHNQIRDYLIDLLRGLRQQLNLSDHHLLCGISQIAIGADTLFTEACGRINAEKGNQLGIAQRIFLPQHLDAYLTAVNSDNEPDFSPVEREAAKQLLSSTHIIQERMVSDAPTRIERFKECGRVILAASDVAIGLVRENAELKLGGTLDFLERAKAVGIPTFEIRLQESGDQLALTTIVHNLPGWTPPELPVPIRNGRYLDRDRSGPLPSVSEFCEAAGSDAETQAGWHSRRFAKAARDIIILHILATILATTALALTPYHNLFWLIVALLVLELLALGAGWRTHNWLHHAKPTHGWALARLLAELSRSMHAVEGLHFYPQYLFNNSLPRELRHLLRTLCVLHLRWSRSQTPNAQARGDYIRKRLDADYPHGQIAYYGRRRNHAAKSLGRATAIFAFCAWLAIVATSAKLVVKLVSHYGESSKAVAANDTATPFAKADSGGPVHGNQGATTKPMKSLLNLLGVLAVALPVLAVGAMSWAASMNYESRMHTFGEMRARLEFHKMQLVEADKQNEHWEFLHHVAETETTLLSETAQWYGRQKFTGVT